MKCPICDEDLKIMYECPIDNDTFEAIGNCKCGLYDGIWLIKKDEKGVVLKECNLKQYWHG